MKITDPSQENEVETLEKLLGGISLVDGFQETKPSNEQANLSSTFVENVIKCEADDPDVQVSQTTEEKDNEVETDSGEQSDKTSDDNDEKILKRGPTPRRTERPSRTSVPYNVPDSSVNQRFSLSSSSSSNLLFCGGGDILQSEGSILNEVAPIPDLDLLLGDSYPVSENVNHVESSRNPLDIEDEFLARMVDEVIGSPDFQSDLNESLPELNNVDAEYVFGNIENSGDSLPLAIPEYNDYSFLDQLSPPSMDDGYKSGSTAGITDYSVNDQFSPLTMGINEYQAHDPFSPKSVGGLNKYQINDQFSPLSTDDGYKSGSPDTRSSCDSPFSPIVGVILPGAASPSAKMEKEKKKRVPRNPFFVDLDENKCDKYRRVILSKAKENDGLNMKDDKKRTLLHIAIQQRNVEYCCVFLNMLEKSFENGTGRVSLPSFPSLASFLDQEDDFGRTPLLAACIYDLPKVVDYLLKCKVSLRIKDNSNGTVWHYMCQRGSRFYDVAEKVCNREPSSINMINDQGETPLHTAVGYHGLEQVDEITKRKEVVDNRRLIELLLFRNAKLSFQDGLGRTPLHWLVLAGNFDLMDLLYQKGCDWKDAVNLKNAMGRSVLHLVCQKSGLDPEKQKILVEKLMVRYASAKLQDKANQYPKDLVPPGRGELIRILSREFRYDTGWCSDDSFF